MLLKERFAYVINWFQTHNPEPETELHYINAYQLLVSVILAAQCTDKRINMVTPLLYEAYPDAFALSKASFDNINHFIKSVSFANNKTRHLMGMSQMLVEQHNGQVPATIEELLQLPGVGRKTANVILSVIFDEQALAVDTHVFRVSARIGLTRNAKTPVQTEQQLLKYLPHNLISKAHHWLILHGRYICIARKPKCEICGLKPACKYFQQVVKPAFPEI